ncbi:hypothetical protein F442_01651 [Phytophthora nicotianae P10297]|uniref:Uncharacterized protein n=1 Tax=Phytophthora nicotianae P10297 TaxID=1317064 RepID=W3A1M4_PHYNI|nr:hypothetical protein F442_01651 [Phytophthora nicotianae P10297]
MNFKYKPHRPKLLHTTMGSQENRTEGRRLRSSALYLSR